MAKSYSWSAILKHLKAGTECAYLAVFETCRPRRRFVTEDEKRTENNNNEGHF